MFDYNESPTINYQEIVLERVRSSMPVASAMLQTDPLRAVDYIIMDFWAEKTPKINKSYKKSVEFTMPASSWQMFKEEHSYSWWLRWLVDKWPVQYTVLEEQVELEIDQQAYIIYPDAPKSKVMGERYVIQYAEPNLSWTS